jgi:hypothetical protein
MLKKILILVQASCIWGFCQIKILDDIGFPFGIKKDTVFNQEEFGTKCLDQSEEDIQFLKKSCYSDEALEKYQLEIGGFSVETVTFDLTADSTEGEYKIYETTLASPKFDECSEMASAKAALMAAILTKYSKGAKIKKGPKFGSEKCKDYMEEGITNYSLEKGKWLLTVDSFWYEDGYTIYVSYRYQPRAQKYFLRKRINKINKASDALNKL